MSLTIVVPVFNEVESVTPLHEATIAVLDRLRRPFEIVLVDDGSTDGSAEALDVIARSDPRVRVVHLDRNYGQTAALDAGFRAARGDLVITMDADLQTDPADIPALLLASEEADVVCGIRTRRQDSILRRLSSSIANTVRRRVTGDRIRDIGCTLKLFRRSDLAKIRLVTGMHRFLPVLLEMEGCTIRQIPVQHRPRRYGRSKYGIRNRLGRAIVDLLGVRWLQRRRLDYRIRSET